MSSDKTAPKKPRARKLERDRAAGAPAKKTSTRHAAAKSAAKKTKAKPETKVRTKKSEAADSAPRSRAARDFDDKPARKSTAGRPSRFADEAPRGRSTRRDDDRPTRGGRRYEDDKPARRTSRDDDRPARSTSRRFEDEAPRGRSTRRDDDRPVRSTRRDDERPARRTSRDDDRPTRGARRYEDDKPARKPAAGRPSRFADEAPRGRSARRDDDRPARRTSRDDDRPSRGGARGSYSDRPRRDDRFREPRRFEEPTGYSPDESAEDLEGIDTLVSSAPTKKSKRAIEHAETMSVKDSTWAALGVVPELAKALDNQGLSKPFPIQAATLPDAIAGRDILGRAQTGSGKTLAFGLALLTRLANRPGKKNQPLGIVLLPTRELAMQVNDTLAPLAQKVGIDTRLVAGGMPYAAQVNALKRGVQILIATPGRLNDLIDQGYADLSQVEIAVLDEADHMSDLGFMPQITEILDLVKPNGQRLLFSATLDKDVNKLVKLYLHDPVEHATALPKAAVSTMEHFLFAVHREDKYRVIEQIAAREGKTIFFIRTQLAVERIADDFAALGIPVTSLHGGKSQGQRTRALKMFKDGTVDVLVATDVAARGIHVDDVSLVVHVDPPADSKDYLHRAGRTARAGETGKVITMIGLRNQKPVIDMMAKAGVEPELVRIRPMCEELIEITGAQEPSGEPWSPPVAKPAGRPPRNRGGDSGGRRPRRR